MATLIHVTHAVYVGLGLVIVRVDASGDPPPDGAAVIARRMVGSTILSYPNLPAGYLSSNATVQLVDGVGLFADTTAPLDTPFEYLSGLPGETLAVAAGPVTVPSGSVWRFGDPLRPYLDVPLTLSRSSKVECPTTAGAKIILSLSNDNLSLQTEVLGVPGSRYPIAIPEPIASPLFDIRIATRAREDREAMEALLAPGGVLLIRPPSPYQMGPRYLIPTGVEIARISADHRKPWRVFTIQARECAQPAGEAYGWLGARWQDLCSGPYATWGDVAAAGLSWGSLGMGAGSSGYPGSITTWTAVGATYPTWADLTATGKTWHELLVGA
jgi:hypothetical protein